MNKPPSRKPVALALGAAFALTGMGAQASVFQFSDLASGYMLAAADAAKAGDKKAEEARCGADCARNMKGTTEADAQAACAKAMAEGRCGSAKEKKEGKCGEGKCGSNKK